MPRIEGTKVGLDGLGRMVHSPIIFVHLLYGGLGLEVQAIVDSGADTTVIPAEVAAAVGASDKSGFWFTNGMNVLRAIKGETMFQPPEQGLTPIMKRQMLNSGMQIPQGG